MGNLAMFYFLLTIAMNAIHKMLLPMGLWRSFLTWYQLAVLADRSLRDSSRWADAGVDDSSWCSNSCCNYCNRRCPADCGTATAGCSRRLESSDQHRLLRRPHEPQRAGLLLRGAQWAFGLRLDPIGGAAAESDYFMQGVCITEVEIDCITGDSRVLRSDILLMDSARASTRRSTSGRSRASSSRLRVVHDGGDDRGRQGASVGASRPTLQPRLRHIQDPCLQWRVARLPRDSGCHGEPLHRTQLQSGGQAAVLYGLLGLLCHQGAQFVVCLFVPVVTPSACNWKTLFVDNISLLLSFAIFIIDVAHRMPLRLGGNVTTTTSRISNSTLHYTTRHPASGFTWSVAAPSQCCASLPATRRRSTQSSNITQQQQRWRTRWTFTRWDLGRLGVCRSLVI